MGVPVALGLGVCVGRGVAVTIGVRVGTGVAVTVGVIVGCGVSVPDGKGGDIAVIAIIGVAVAPRSLVAGALVFTGVCG